MRVRVHVVVYGWMSGWMCGIEKSIILRAHEIQRTYTHICVAENPNSTSRIGLRRIVKKALL